ncbi:MAG: tyrosine-type recombinase/integrase [Lachnospiraceae bacterium]|nr:tyrosine-type recombinase/integrase [Lachnospiraceae bacterium]
MSRMIKEQTTSRRAHGEGSMTKKRINGRDYCVLTKWIGDDARKRVSVYGRTEREAIMKMKKKESEYLEDEKLSIFARDPVSTSSTQSTVNDEILLEEAVFKWLETYKKPELKARSYDTIYSTYKTYCKGTKLGRTMLSNITAEDIQVFLNGIYKDKSISTAKKTFQMYSMFFSFFYMKSPRDNPMLFVKSPSGEKALKIDEDGIVDTGEMEVLSDNEIARLSEDMKREPTSACYMILFIMWTYVRLGECQAIQYRDIDFENRTIKIYKAYARVRRDDKDIKEGEPKWEWKLFAPKTKMGRRVIKLSPQAMDALNNHLRLLRTKRIDVLNGNNEIDPRTFIFNTVNGNPFASQNLITLLKSAFKRCGITKHVTIHGLRHTGISYFIRHGADIKVISQQAGHSDVGTTTRIYYNIINEQIDDVYAKFEYDAKKEESEEKSLYSVPYVEEDN